MHAFQEYGLCFVAFKAISISRSPKERLKIPSDQDATDSLDQTISRQTSNGQWLTFIFFTMIWSVDNVLMSR